jgi:hypothetical protein
MSRSPSVVRWTYTDDGAAYASVDGATSALISGGSAEPPHYRELVRVDWQIVICQSIKLRRRLAPCEERAEGNALVGLADHADLLNGWALSQ